MKDLTTVNQGKATTVQDCSGKCITEERQILNRWTEYCSELYNYKASGDSSVLNCPQTDTEYNHPSFLKKLRLQYNHWRKGNHLELTTSLQNWSKQVEKQQSPLSRKSATRSGRLERGQPHGPSPRSSHFPMKATCSSARTTEQSASSAIQAKSWWYTTQIEAASVEDHCCRTGRLQSRMEHHRAAFQPMNPFWETSPAPARLLPCLHSLQDGLQQCLVCSFVGNHEKVQHQHQPYLSHQTPLWQGHPRSPVQGQHWRLVLTTVGVWQGCLLSPTPFNISGKDHDICLR